VVALNDHLHQLVVGIIRKPDFVVLLICFLKTTPLSSCEKLLLEMGKINFKKKADAFLFKQIRLAEDSLQRLILLILHSLLLRADNDLGKGYLDAALARDFTAFFFMSTVF